MPTALYDLSPALRMLWVGALLATGPVVWVWLRQRGAHQSGRLRALTMVTLFLTFDLVLFGAFTRLTDSGLGCPDWPGCYGSASPLGAKTHIDAAQSAMPTGPVTHSKAWVEMVHRYLATGVGALITVLAVSAWWQRRTAQAPHASTALSPWWPTVTWVWVCIQGAFGALTVTMKLFPAIVTLHLLGGYVLLALLVVQAVALSRNKQDAGRPHLLHGVRVWVWSALVILVVQAASGAWVSTNYAVLACTDFPQCQGSWWPSMDMAQGFEMWRPLGHTSQGEVLSFQALVAIHWAHRLLAVLTVTVLGSLTAYLWGFSTLRTPVRILAGLLLLQVTTGISNAVLDWPLLAAVLHTGGAGAMVAVLVWILTATQGQTAEERAHAFQQRFSQ